MEFSGAARYNEEAPKDLFNSALDEPLSWWRIRGQDHLTFGEFVEFLARSPAKVADVPQVVGDETAAPPVAAGEAAEPQVAADEAAVSPMAGDEAAAHPMIPGLVRKLADTPMRTLGAAGIPRLAPPKAVVPVPEPAPFREPTELLQSPLQSVSPQSPIQSLLCSESPESPLGSGSPQSPLRSVSPQSPLKSSLRPGSPQSSLRPGIPQSPLRSGSPQSPLRSRSPESPLKSSLRPGSPQSPLRSRSLQSPLKSSLHPGSPQSLLLSGSPQSPLRSVGPQVTAPLKWRFSAPPWWPPALPARPGLLLCLPCPSTPVCLLLQTLFHSTGLAHRPSP